MIFDQTFFKKFVIKLIGKVWKPGVRIIPDLSEEYKAFLIL